MKQPRAIEMNVRHVQTHWSAFGNFPRFVQIFLSALGAGVRAGEKAQPCASKEAGRKMVLGTCSAETTDGIFDL